MTDEELCRAFAENYAAEAVRLRKLAKSFGTCCVCKHYCELAVRNVCRQCLAAVVRKLKGDPH